MLPPAAVGEEVRELHPFVLGEVPGVDVLAAFDQDDLAAPLGHPVGEDRAGGAAADDHHVRVDLLGVDFVRVVDVQRGAVLRHALDRLLVAGALGEGDIADRGCRPRVGVIADDREVLGRGEHRLQRLAKETGQPSFDHVVDEAALDEGQPPVRRHHREGGSEAKQRVDGERGQRQLRLPLALGGERVQVVVDPGGNLLRRKHLLGSDHQDLSHRHRGAVLVRGEVAKAIAGLRGRVVEQGEKDDDGGSRPGPGEQYHGRVVEVDPKRVAEGAVDAAGVAEGEHEQEAEDDQAMARNHQQPSPAVLANVAGGDEAEDREEAILGERVGDEGELCRTLDALDQIGDREPEEKKGEKPKGDLQPPLLRCQLGALQAAALGRLRLGGLGRARLSILHAHRPQRGRAVVVLAHSHTLLVREGEDLHNPVGDLEPAVLATAGPARGDDDVIADLEDMLDLEAELADGGPPLRPELLDPLVAAIGARVGVLGRRHPLDVLAHVLEHPGAVARVPGLVPPTDKFSSSLGHAPSQYRTPCQP